MHHLTKAFLGAALLTASAASAQAALLINSVVGGAPTLPGVVRENFDALPLGAAGGALGSGITVNFTPNAGAVRGSVANQYAAPFLSGSNGAGFGAPDQADGRNATTYLIAGSGGTATAGARVELLLPGLQSYLGLLWGSVDSFNVLSFFQGATEVGRITGADVAARPNGNQGRDGTRYVNITSDADATRFDRLVFTSRSATFEFDNVAISRGIPVPAPAGLALLGLGLAGLVAARRARRAA